MYRSNVKWCRLLFGLLRKMICSGQHALAKSLYCVYYICQPGILSDTVDHELLLQRTAELFIRVHLIFANFASKLSIKSRN